MATVKTLIGNIKGPKGDTGATGATGPTGPIGPQGPPGVIDKDTPVEFTQGTEYALPASGEAFGSLIGKTVGDIAILKTGLDNVSGSGVYASDSTEAPIDIALDADTLGGQAPSYYAKQADIAKQNKKLWEGTPISSGQILCDTTGYTVYDFYCTDGLMLRGVKILDTTNGKHYAVLGGSGGAYNGSAYVPAVWYGLIDIYDTHFYLHNVTMYTIQDGQSYSSHQISAIYGVW